MSEKQNICPIMYTRITSDEKYSIKGLRKLSPSLQVLQDLPYTAEQQLVEARMHADKMSIQGVQPKLSAKLDTKNQTFEICDTKATYILKPQNPAYLELPENEDLTMHLAQKFIEVPLHGLLYCVDGSFTYFIKRFDRIAQGNKIPVEDFAQLSGLSRDTKYQFSMEKIVPLIEKYCTFPAIEKAKLFTRVVFNYLIGNEDMHVKNYSLITRDNIVTLAPAYDFINTTIAVGVNKVKEQIAIPINGKKSNLTRKDIVDYYGMQKLGLQPNVVNEILNKFTASLADWRELIDISFLSDRGKNEYHMVLDERNKSLNLQV